MGFSSTGKLVGADDVATSSVTQGQTIAYSVVLQKWVNVSPAVTPGIVQLDDFTGVNDDAKLTAAMDYVKAQPYIPAIQFPARVVTLSQTRTPYNGMRLIGSGAQAGSSKTSRLARR